MRIRGAGNRGSTDLLKLVLVIQICVSEHLGDLHGTGGKWGTDFEIGGVSRFQTIMIMQL